MEWVLIPLAALFIGLVAVVLEHREKMMKASLGQTQKDGKTTATAIEQLTSDYQEFVLGVDARLQRLEDRIRRLESRTQQTGGSEDTQQVHRGG